MKERDLPNELGVGVMDMDSGGVGLRGANQDTVGDNSPLAGVEAATPIRPVVVGWPRWPRSRASAGNPTRGTKTTKKPRTVHNNGWIVVFR